ncbi:MAG: LysM peptidoglycan-binding domain-containing protein [Microgenomates group bacterium]
MKKVYRKTPNYQKELLQLIHKKYFDLILGMLISLIFSFYGYRFINKKINLHFFITLPKLDLKTFLTKKSPSKSQMATTKPTITYIVQEGDDLWHIAEKFYGSGFNAYDISKANNLDPSTSIYAGQKLIIPSVKPRTPTVGETSSLSTNQVIYTEDKYVVQPGDSLSLIAQKVYGDLYAWPKILQANNLQNPDQIEVGTVLIIPR